MNTKISLGAGMLLVLSLGGCAAVQPQSHFEAVQTLGQERVQAEIVWSQDPEQVQENFQRARVLAQDGEQASRAVVKT